MRERITYANVTATIAVFLAIGGTAAAALSGKERNTVKKIANAQIAARAAGLSVASASTANTANTANSLLAPDPPTLAALGNAAAADCTGLPTGWFDLDPATYHEVGYYRDRQGRVFLQGRAPKCGSPSANVFSLPAGFRPGKNVTLTASIGAGPAIATVTISSAAGLVAPSPTPASGSFVNLDGLSFRCGPSGANGCP